VADFLHSLLNIQSPFNMIVLVVLIGSVVGLLSTIVVQVRLYAAHRADVQLKRELVERGLNADEIERVVAAKTPSETQGPLIVGTITKDHATG
jgi:hypothetical protein